MEMQIQAILDRRARLSQTVQSVTVHLEQGHMGATIGLPTVAYSWAATSSFHTLIHTRWLSRTQKPHLKTTHLNFITDLEMYGITFQAEKERL